MDCHVFRRLCDELIPLLQGARIEKIHAPLPGLTVFQLYAHGQKTNLFLRADHKRPFVFISSTRIPAPPSPPAFVMRLRKHCAGRIIRDVRSVWADRCLYLAFQDGPDSTSWLELNLRNGPVLFSAPPEPVQPAWPEDNPAEADWRLFPMVTPALRRTLLQLPDMEARSLWADLQQGGGDLFAYLGTDGVPVSDLSAWPLPHEPAGATLQVFESAISATGMYGEKIILPEAIAAGCKPILKKQADTIRKLDKLLEKTKLDEERLRSMQAAKQNALAIQAELFHLHKHQKISELHLEYSGLVIRLNPAKTIQENMEHFFHEAERGTRGLKFLQERIAHLQAEREKAVAIANANAVSPTAFHMAPQAPHRHGAAARAWPHEVEPFQSMDGFTLLRGRSAAGNARLLKLVSAHDMWCHAGGAAGAHVVIRVDHALQEIPLTTKQQAACLALEKSELRGSAAAEAIFARIRHIKAIKGSRTGAVHIEKLEDSLTVQMDAVPHATPLPSC